MSTTNSIIENDKIKEGYDQFSELPISDLTKIKKEEEEPVVNENISQNNELFQSGVISMQFMKMEDERNEWNINDRRGNRMNIQCNENINENNEHVNADNRNINNYELNKYGMHILGTNEEISETINEIEHTESISDKLRNKILTLLKKPHPDIDRYFNEKKKKKNNRNKPKMTENQKNNEIINKRADIIMKCIIDSLRTQLYDPVNTSIEKDALRKVLISLSSIKYSDYQINTNLHINKSYTKTVKDIDSKLDFIMQILQY